MVENHGKHCHRSSLWALKCVFWYIVCIVVFGIILKFAYFPLPCFKENPLSSRLTASNSRFRGAEALQILHLSHCHLTRPWEKPLNLELPTLQILNLCHGKCMQRTWGLSLWHVDGLPVVVLCCFSVVLDRLGPVELKNVGFLHGGGTKVCNRHWLVNRSNENSKDSFHQTCCHGI